MPWKRPGQESRLNWPHPDRDCGPLVSEAASILASTADPTEALARLTRLVVDAFSEFCAVMLPAEHQLHVVAAAHQDPANDSLARLLVGPIPASVESSSPSVTAFRTGRVTRVKNLGPSQIAGWFEDDTYTGWLQSMGLRSIIAIPLESRGSVIGVMTLGFTDESDGTGLDPCALDPFARLVAVAVQHAEDQLTSWELAAVFRHRRNVAASSVSSGVDQPCRVLIIDPYPVVRVGVKAMVDDIGGMICCGEAGSVGEATEQDIEPDVIITGMILSDGNGPAVVGQLLAGFPQAGVVVLSRVDRPAYVHLAMAAGARGFLVKTASVDELAEALRCVADGGQYIQPALGAALSRWQPLAEGRVDDVPVTPREREVLALVALGHTNTEIATILMVSVRTVETYRAALTRKLGARSRSELLARARELFPD